MNNLEIQRDFTNRKDLCERIAAVKASNPEERDLIAAIGQFLPTMLGDVTVSRSDFETQLEEFPSRDSLRIKELYYTLIDEHRPRRKNREAATHPDLSANSAQS